VIADIFEPEAVLSNKIIQNANLPAYVYDKKFLKDSLFQGDILRVSGVFQDYFLKFYPEVTNIEGEEKYVMVLTQSCDLVKSHKRKLKVSHINVCLIRTLKNFIHSLISEIKPLSLGGKNLLEEEVNDRIKDKIRKLLGNSDQKVNFFLPKELPFEEDMVALIPLSFSFRADHYDVLLQNKVLTLMPEFRAKVGYIISELYGRVGTPDLSDSGWDDKQVRNYINGLLHDLNLVQVPNKQFLQYIQKNWSDNGVPINNLIEECFAENFKEDLKGIKQALKTRLTRLFEDKEKIDLLQGMDKRSLSKEIVNILDESGF